MSFSQLLNRWGWLDLVIGGILWGGFHIWYIQVATINDPEQIIPVVWILGVATIFLMLGLYSLFGLAVSGGVKVSLALTMIGMGLFALGTVLTSTGLTSAWLFAIIGEMITSIGLLIFGVVNFRERLLGILFWLPLLLAPIYIISWAIDPGTINMPVDNWTEWLAALYGLGWVIIGIGLYLQEKG